MGRLLIYAGVLLIVAGLFWQFGERFGLGQLPGDINIKKDGYSVQVPLMTCLLFSIACSGLMWFIGWLRR